MISNLPDDVVHDLLRDLKLEIYGFRPSVYPFNIVKQAIETWEANRDKYLATVVCREGKNWLDEHADSLFKYNPDTIGKLPDGSGFIVP